MARRKNSAEMLDILRRITNERNKAPKSSANPVVGRLPFLHEESDPILDDRHRRGRHRPVKGERLEDLLKLVDPRVDMRLRLGTHWNPDVFRT